MFFNSCSSRSWRVCQQKKRRSNSSRNRFRIWEHDSKPQGARSFRRATAWYGHQRDVACKWYTLIARCFQSDSWTTIWNFRKISEIDCPFPKLGLCECRPPHSVFLTAGFTPEHVVRGWPLNKIFTHRKPSYFTHFLIAMNRKMRAVLFSMELPFVTDTAFQQADPVTERGLEDFHDVCYSLLSSKAWCSAVKNPMIRFRALRVP